MYVHTHVSFEYVCIYVCIHRCICIRARALSHLIQLTSCTVITCECSQYGMTALLLASRWGNAETVRVLVELGASLEAVDEVHIHAHALAYTCCIKHVSGIMRMTMIFFTPSPKKDHLIFSFEKNFY